MADPFDFSGTWHSAYRYTSTAKPGDFISEYDVKVHLAGSQAVIQSIPDESGAYILLRLTVDGRVLTGTWHEQTSPTGDYKGTTYYGAVQLVMDENGKTMRGKYVGFNRKMQVQGGDWEITKKD